jgi:hypothetical protein
MLLCFIGQLHLLNDFLADYGLDVFNQLVFENPFVIFVGLHHQELKSFFVIHINQQMYRGPSFSIRLGTVTSILLEDGKYVVLFGHSCEVDRGVAQRIAMIN